MPKFTVTTTFDLYTELSPEVHTGDLAPEDAIDFSDNSYWSESTLECSGGEISYTIEAEDEDAAESYAERAVSEGSEFEDSNGVTWGATNVSHEIERIIEPMTLARAREILADLADGQEDEDVSEAVNIVFATIMSLETRLHETNQRINGLVDELRAAREIPSLASLAAEIVNTLPDSGAPVE